MFQNRNFPQFRPDYMLHYDNDSCFATNWSQLWSECRSTDPPKRLYVCRAAYHMTGENHQVVDGLAELPLTEERFHHQSLTMQLMSCVFQLAVI